MNKSRSLTGKNKDLNLQERTDLIITETPVPESEIRRTIRVADWNRIHRKISSVRTREWYGHLEPISCLVLGIGIPLMFTDFMTGAVIILIGLICYLSYMRLDNNINQDVGEILTDINEINAGFKSKGK